MWCPNVKLHPLISARAAIQISGPTTISLRFCGDEWVE